MAGKSLRFMDLNSRHEGITDGIAGGFAEAVRVCMDRHHTSPVAFAIRDGEVEHYGSVEWPAADDRTRNGWANKDDATEAGACGLSLAAIEALRGLVAVRRAETRTGADYYLGRPGEAAEDLEASFRLEVSGTDEGGVATIERRLTQKIEQARRGNSNVPAIASVVGFAALRIVSADVDET